MISKAAIFVDAPRADQADAPRALLQVGGLSLLERQLRQLKTTGIDEVLLISSDFPEAVQVAVQKFRRVPPAISVIDGRLPVRGAWQADDMLLLIEDGVLIDSRLIATVMSAAEAGAPHAAFYPPRSVVVGIGDGTAVEWADEDRLFASVAAVSGAVLTEASDVEDGSARLNAALDGLRAADGQEIAIGEIATYMPGLRRDLEILWRPVSSQTECAKATAVLIGRSQKSVLDWPARFIHPPVENLLVRLALPLPITPNFVTGVSTLIGLGIAYLFASGHMLAGLALALTIGALDGVDGTLARVKLLTSRIGQLEHILDKVVEYGWYLAIASYLAQVTGSQTAWALSAALICFSWAEGVQGEFYRRLTLRQLDDAGNFERTFRLVGARRNTIVWALIPFALYEVWMTGLWFMTAYTVVTFFVAQWRFIVRIRDYLAANSPAVAENIQSTRYF